MLSPEFQQAGARNASARAPEQITLDWLQSECSRLERILRLQYPDGKLSPQDERVLASYQPIADTTRGMRCWAYLKHLYLCRTEKRQRASENASEARDAAVRLLRRDAVPVHLSNGRVVQATSRSYLASYAIARHWARIQVLHAKVQDAEYMGERVEKERRSLPPWSRRRRHLRRRLARLEALAWGFGEELARHRKQLYAHAMTPSGAPAESASEAPDWWAELTPDDDAALLAGIAAAGIVRWAKVQEARAAEPKPKSGADPKPWQDGWGVLFASIEKEMGLEPAELFNRDLYQTLAWVEQLPELSEKESA